MRNAIDMRQTARPHEGNAVRKARLCETWQSDGLAAARRTLIDVIFMHSVRLCWWHVWCSSCFSRALTWISCVKTYGKKICRASLLIILVHTSRCHSSRGTKNTDFVGARKIHVTPRGQMRLRGSRAMDAMANDTVRSGFVSADGALSDDHFYSSSGEPR